MLLEAVPGFVVPLGDVVCEFVAALDGVALPVVGLGRMHKGLLEVCDVEVARPHALVALAS